MIYLVLNEEIKIIPANICLGEDDLKISLRGLEDAFRVIISRREIVTRHYNKNRQPFCDLFRSWLSSTFL